ncbi:MAG: NAD(P)H-hydrate dehydratase [Clostridia bacterium]|nr:NAD(P)H-hydrate dehydratase [Clostridiales bacterium]MCR5804158.1 NAD(P)H-hydrate dehydratase [Clostridia bacterium]
MNDSLDSIRKLFPPRSDKGHKTSFGSLLVVAGSDYMSGAAVLTVSAALRTGVGIVKILSSEKCLDAVRTNCPCALLGSYDQSGNLLHNLSSMLKGCTAAVIGPGLDVNDARNKEILIFLIENAPKLVIDASALTILSSIGCECLKNRDTKRLAPVIMTPHVGEFKRLKKDAAGLNYDAFNASEISVMTRPFATEYGAILVLKNFDTLITAPDGKCYYMYGGNSGMAKGGSGDVLTGIIGGLLASGLDPVDAAQAGVMIHTRAGKISAEELTKLYMLPTDIIRNLPLVYKELGW